MKRRVMYIGRNVSGLVFHIHFHAEKLCIGYVVLVLGRHEHTWRSSVHFAVSFGFHLIRGDHLKSTAGINTVSVVAEQIRLLIRFGVSILVIVQRLRRKGWCERLLDLSINMLDPRGQYFLA